MLFLAVDDMKDWVNCLGGYEGTVHTPNIDRLASRGMLFTNAHCPSPKCAPSRAAIMTGLRPSTTGLYDNSHWWLPKTWAESAEKKGAFSFDPSTYAWTHRQKGTITFGK